MIDAVFAPVESAIAQGKIPGAVLGILDKEGVRHIRHAGVAQRVPTERAMTPDKVFDLASLTKVLLTVPSVLRLVAEGRIDLDDPISAAIPDLYQYVAGHALRKITLRQCLSHQSGLPAVEPIYTWGSDAETLKALVLQKDWPLGANVYSDINFIWLGLVVERLTGKKLRDLAVEAGFQAGAPASQAVATENCQWRGRVMCGEVHDENAYSLGGISGHAGLFGTVDQVLDAAEAILKQTWLPKAALDAMVEPQSDQRALGWERRYPGWPGGSLCSPGTIGHTGFTGVGLWVDRDRGFAWTLLTNRVHPSRHFDSGIMPLRRAVGNLTSALLA
ncbi:serine hydrolase domain-containing protein [Lacibacterium aquatile]|uniref:Serine hydrolase domain-containing protein n=1 Tax=Lacibacterium aquatile TaxID=1168082 RepID=A0ABW5DVD5_9PROT